MNINISQSNSQAMKNPWVLGMLLFLFVFLTANAVFIYLAFSSPPSLVVEDFYERGEIYEETQKRIAQEKKLGWNGTLLAPSKLRVNQSQKFEVLLQGKNSVALTLDSVEFNAYRPSDSKADFIVPMTKNAPGNYSADVSFDLPGIWDIIIVAKHDDKEFLVTKRLSVSP